MKVNTNTQRCVCGRALDSPSKECYSEKHYRNGVLIYALCSHGEVIVDGRDLASKILVTKETEHTVWRSSK